MAKQIWKPGNMLYPLPAVMVSTADCSGNANILTIAWTGTVCTNPPMTYISVRPERHSYRMIKESGEFVINLTTERLMDSTDFCGVISGRDTDKWKACGLTKKPASALKYAPVIAESPVNIECRVERIEELGSHHMFLAHVAAVQIDESYMDEKGKFQLNRAGLIAYSHGEYLSLGKKLGTFGCSVRKKTSSPGQRGKKGKSFSNGGAEKRIRKKRMKGHHKGKNRKE